MAGGLAVAVYQWRAQRWSKALGGDGSGTTSGGGWWLVGLATC